MRHCKGNPSSRRCCEATVLKYASSVETRILSMLNASFTTHAFTSSTHQSLGMAEKSFSSCNFSASFTPSTKRSNKRFKISAAALRVKVDAMISLGALPLVNKPK